METMMMIVLIGDGWSHSPLHRQISIGSRRPSRSHTLSAKKQSFHSIEAESASQL